ncbi:nuclear RNA export factor 2-like isoform X2 [Rhagoletis pomonella]|nr:nuclear RNA export factor 2-like isoform X2 [Rhagoletis pomonella]
MSISRPDDVYHFPNNLPIEVNYKNTQTYSKCSSYDPKVMAQGFVWHQIVVQHNGKMRGRDGIQETLDAIFDAVEGEELFPVAYRRGSKEDRFLVRQCKAAINKLFEQNLRIQLSDASFVNLQVQFNVGDFKFGQISPHAKLTEAINRLFTCMERINGVSGILNLSRFNAQTEFFDLIVNLGNRTVLETVCNLIYRNEKFRLVNGFNLSENGITSVAPLAVFSGASFAVLDLRKNKIISSSRVCRDLNDVKADELMLAGNPVTKSSNYPECMRPVLKNFKAIDGIPAENLSKDYTPMDYEVDIDKDGYRVDFSNKEDMIKFLHSSDWHAIMDNTDLKKEGSLTSQKNFLCDVRGYDFVDEFVPLYFKAFDSNERQSLKELYQRNAMLTVSFNYHIAQMTSQNFRRISKYRENSRNILKMSDLSRAHTTIHLGSDQIMQTFLQLPSIRHDLLTFSTDTTIYNDKIIVITISGVFYDQAPSMMDNDILMAFTRSFVLTPVEKHQGILGRAIKYQICNEQLSIYNPTAQQTKKAFKYFKTEGQNNDDEVTVADKEALIIMFQEVTNLKWVWCTR